MPEEQLYIATSTLLTKRANENVWTVTFSPAEPPPGLPFDPDAGREIVITITPAMINKLVVGIAYTRAEIEAFGTPS